MINPISHGAAEQLEARCAAEGPDALSLVELGAILHYKAAVLKKRDEEAFRRRWDSDGCDEGCGQCRPGRVCFWHEGAKVPWPRIVTKADRERFVAEQEEALRAMGFRPMEARRG